MGQVNATPTDSFDSTKRVRYQDFVKNYLFVRKIKDPRYGEISLLQDKLTKQNVALREMALNNSKDLERDSTALQARSKISHPNIIKILGYTSKSEEFIYSSEHKILVIMEYVENDLEKEIQMRKPKNEFYREEQLWYILENTMKALLEFQRNVIAHGDIKTSSVLMSKMGVYKLIQPNVISTASPITSRFLSDDNKPYLSPAQLSQKNGAKVDHHPWKSDVFSLGMVLLHAATLSPSDKLYNWRDNTINTGELEQTLSALKMIYSERLQNLLRKMLSFEEDKRPDFFELERLISASEVVTKNVQQQQQPKQAPTLKFRVLEVPGTKSETKPKENESAKKMKKLKVGMKTVLQENNANVSTKTTESREAHLVSSEQKRVKSPPAKIFEEKPLHSWDKPRSKLQNENTVMRMMTEPSQPPFLSKTYTKDKSNVAQECRTSPLHTMQTMQTLQTLQTLQTMNFHTEGDDYDPTLAREFFSATKPSVKHDNRSPVASLNSPQPKGLVTSQYKSLISNEVAQLMADFESRKDRNRSPGRVNVTQNISRVTQKENLETSGEVGSIRSPNSKLLQNIVNGGGTGSIKHAGSPVQFDKSAYDTSQRSPNHTILADMRPTLPAGSSSTSDLQREKVFQNPYFPGAPVSPDTQPRTIQKQAPVAIKTNGFYMLGNYATPQNKPRQMLSPSNSALNLRPPEMSFDSNNNYSHNYSVNKTYNIPTAADTNVSNSEQVPSQLANSKSDPYLLFNRSNDQQVFEKPSGFSDSYETIQPKDSVKSTSSASSLKPYLIGSNQEETVSEKFADGSVYKGQKKNGLRHGKGTYHHSDGSMYSGDWFRGLMQGQGTLYYAGGSKAYQGQWREDKFDGKGVVFNEFPAKLLADFDFRNFDNVGEYWVHYEGDFFNDQKQGTGTLFLTNGERYQGQFREDMVEGIGVFYSRSGKAIKGEWYKNRLVRPL